MYKLIAFILVIQFSCVCTTLTLPSTSYGARAFGLNVNDSISRYVNISYPFDMGYDTVSDIDSESKYISVISKYDSWWQKWISAAYVPELELWATNFMIHLGGVYKLLVYNDYAPSLGFAGAYEEIPSYNLHTYHDYDYYYKGYNYIMHHPAKSDIKRATQLGNDLVNCDAIQKWDPYTHTLMSSYLYDSYFGYWDNDFDIQITDPIMVNVWSPQKWPVETIKKGSLKLTDNEIKINDPLPVYFHIQTASKSEYDFSNVDTKNSTVTFKAWITGRENEILTHNDYGCGFEQIGDAFSAIYINLGNFETQWKEGDEVNFLITDESTNNKSGNLQGKGNYIASLCKRGAFRGFEPDITGSGEPIVLGTPADIDDNTPYVTELFQNYPNPFNPVTTINFSLRTDCKVKLRVFNYKGQVVKEIINDNLVKGFHKVDFIASNMSSGMYFYTLEADNTKLIKKMVLVR